MKIFFLIISFIYLFLYLILAAKTNKFKKTIFGTTVIGVALLVAVHISGCYLGFMVPLNLYTVSFSALTGLPGVVLISVLPFIFI